MNIVLAWKETRNFFITEYIPRGSFKDSNNPKGSRRGGIKGREKNGTMADLDSAMSSIETITD